MKLIDLTQTFTDNMPVFPGDPPSTLKQTASIDEHTYTDHQINSLMHVGTHMDAPLHMIKNGKTMDKIDLKQCFGKGILIDARNQNKVDVNLLKDIEISEGSIVLIYTNFSHKYRTQAYYEDNPYITKEFAEYLVKKKIKIVGMDILGPDTDITWPAHKVLLGHEVLIIENLTNLDKLIGVEDFEVIALPAKFHSDAAPVRVIAKISE